jgi:hypothetical protein
MLNKDNRAPHRDITAQTFTTHLGSYPEINITAHFGALSRIYEQVSFEIHMDNRYSNRHQQFVSCPRSFGASSAFNKVLQLEFRMTVRDSSHLSDQLKSESDNSHNLSIPVVWSHGKELFAVDNGRTRTHGFFVLHIVSDIPKIIHVMLRLDV